MTARTQECISHNRGGLESSFSRADEVIMFARWAHQSPVLPLLDNIVVPISNMSAYFETPWIVWSHREFLGGAFTLHSKIEDIWCNDWNELLECEGTINKVITNGDEHFSWKSYHRCNCWKYSSTRSGISRVKNYTGKTMPRPENPGAKCSSLKANARPHHTSRSH